jgi:hypothetical protein
MDEKPEERRSDALVVALVRALQQTASREELAVFRKSIDEQTRPWTSLLQFADELVRQAARLELPQSAEAAQQPQEPPRPEDSEGLKRWLGLDENLNPVPVDTSLVKVRSQRNGR